MKILHVDSSITGDNSASRTLSGAIVRELLDAEPDAKVVYRDLVAHPLDHLTLPGFATEESREVLAEFKAADVIVIGAGMYNLSIPSQLKAWFDRVMIAGETFRYTASGPEGLAREKLAIVALARGGQYGPDSPQREVEHAERYIESVLRFVGIEQRRIIVAEGLNVSPEIREAAMAAASEAIRELAETCPA